MCKGCEELLNRAALTLLYLLQQAISSVSGFACPCFRTKLCPGFTSTP